MTHQRCIFLVVLFLLRLGVASSLSQAEKLLQLASSSGRSTLLPGVHDALSARIFQRAGAQALFVSGFGVSASRLAAPDAGILTYAEMEQAARAVVQEACGPDIPVIVDGDTGYGGSATLRRAVKGYAALGAAAITIEDQVFPKKCTYIAGSGVRVIPRDDSMARIRTAVAARQEALERDGRHILIVGRTDCRAALGFDEAVQRCLAYQEMGCDIVYAEALASPDEYLQLRRQISKETPMILAQVQTNDQEKVLTLGEVSDLGYNFALYGVTPLQAVVTALEQAATEMLQNGIAHSLSSFTNVKEVVGFPELEDFEHKYFSE